MAEPVEPTIWTTIAKVAPGFLGAVVAAVYLQRPVNKTEGVVAILAGFFTSVFMTPYIVSLFAPGNVHAYAGIGYGLGMTTVVLLPPLMRRAVELIGQMSLADFLPFLKKKD